MTGVAGRLRNVEVFLLAETEMKTEISEDDFANAKRVNQGEIWRPRRDLNPCYRRERLASGFKLTLEQTAVFFGNRRFSLCFAHVAPVQGGVNQCLVMRVNCPEIVPKIVM